MSFLGMGTFEILIILLVAFIFLGPERMIDAARILGKWTGELRRMGSTVQAEMNDLTNVGSPLSSRYEQGQNGQGKDSKASTLDQDHPPDAPDPTSSNDSELGAPVPFGQPSGDGSQLSGDETRSVRREDVQ